jgi:hypothetical protein
MVEDFRWWVWGAGVCAVALAVAFGPLVAGFVCAGAAFAFMLALMGARAARFIGDWRLEHPRLAHLRLRSRRAR